MTTPQQDALIEALRLAGIEELTGRIPGGPGRGSHGFAIGLDDIDSFLADPIGYKARQLRVSRAKFIAWQRFVEEECRCRGTTRRGRRCRNGGPPFYRPEEFAEGISDYCDIHRGFR